MSQGKRIYKRRVPMGNLHRDTVKRRVLRMEAGISLLTGKTASSFLNAENVIEPETEFSEESSSDALLEPSTEPSDANEWHDNAKSPLEKADEAQELNGLLYNCVQDHLEPQQKTHHENAADSSSSEDDQYEVRYSKKLSASKNLLMFRESSVTVEQTLNMIQAIKLRHSLSDVVVDSILEYTKILAGPRFNSFDVSMYDINSFNKPATSTKSYSFYCPTCKIILCDVTEKKQLGSKKTSKCNKCQKLYVLSKSNKYHFVNIDLQYQLENIFKDSYLVESVVNNFHKFQERSKINDGLITDIGDSELYKKNNFIKSCISNNKDDIVATLTVNVDGAAMFKHTKHSLWSILCVINELSINERFKIVLNAGAWYAESEPNHQDMNMFMRKFLEQMAKLKAKGIKVKYKGKRINIFVVPIFFACDAMARSPLGGRVTVSGYSSCFWCYIYGSYQANAVRFPLQELPNSVYKGYPLRTHELYLRDAKIAEDKNYLERVVKGNKTTKTTEMGVKGKTVLAEDTDLDTIWSLPPEYLHLLLLGVVKDEWEEITDKECIHFLKKVDRETVDKRLTSIRPTSSMYRVPSKLVNRVCWKSADWLYWLLFYSPVCLEGILHEESLKLLLILAKSTYSLLESKITYSTLEYCKEEIFSFIKGCQKLYGIPFITSNVHALLHLPNTVEKCGPLWGISAFPFESKVANIKRGVDKPTGVGDQVADNVSEYYNFRTKLIKIENNAGKDGVDIPTQFCLNKLFKREKPFVNFILSEEGAMVYADEKMKTKNVFDRCYFKNVPVHSILYVKCKKTDNSVIQLTDDSIVQVNYFSLLDNKLNLHVQELKTVPFEKSDILLTYLLSVVSREEEKIVSISNFKSVLLHMKLATIGKEYVCILPAFSDVK